MDKVRLKAPEDGIVASARKRGWLGARWLELFDPIRSSHHTQLARGRTLARAGRVRDLWFAPGIAHAEVVTPKESYRVSIRVRVYEDKEWDRLTKLLIHNLSAVAYMLEGKLPRVIVERLADKGLALRPSLTELDGNCDCADFHLPCSHVAAVHNVLADALDGDPFLLLTLRGRNRDQLLAAMRRSWGDTSPLLPTKEERQTLPPMGCWMSCPDPLPPLEFKIALTEANAIGLRGLGPPPGRIDLMVALGPLYESGSEAAYAAAMTEPKWHNQDIPPYGWVREWTGETPRPATSRRLRPTNTGQVDREQLAEQLVTLLSEEGAAQSKELAEKLKIPLIELRQELLELEKLGIVYRTGQTRGTRWWVD
jgi:uncharacterized Zn finger protein